MPLLHGIHQCVNITIWQHSNCHVSLHFSTWTHCDFKSAAKMVLLYWSNVISSRLIVEFTSVKKTSEIAARISLQEILRRKKEINSRQKRSLKTCSRRLLTYYHILCLMHYLFYFYNDTEGRPIDTDLRKKAVALQKDLTKLKLLESEDEKEVRQRNVQFSQRRGRMIYRKKVR